MALPAMKGAHRRTIPVQAALFAEPPAEDMETVLSSIMARLGIAAPLTYERQLIALDRIVIPGRTRLRSIAGYARNIKLVGVLHDPAVMPITGSPDFLAVFGRHRLAGATAAGETAIWVRIYPALDARIVAFLRLSEQRRRTTHWLSELEAIIEVIDDRVALTEDELALSLGIDRRAIREYIKMARLPFLVRETVLSGTLARPIVRMILRMPGAQVQTLEQHITDGEPIDATIVKQWQQQRYSATLTQIPCVPPPTPPERTSTAPSQEALLGETLQLLRQLDLFQRVVIDAAPVNQSRIVLSCRMLIQELRLVAQATLEKGGAA